MSHPLQHLLDNNRRWAERRESKDPDFFKRLSGQQKPEYLWIGCADSRVPANQIIGLDPGEVFVHRNVANIVPSGDLNSHAVIQFAVDVLKVKHVIVCGHYGCGGVQAVVEDLRFGLVDEWLDCVRDVHSRHAEEIEALPDVPARVNRLCEHNVAAQVRAVARTHTVRDAWKRGQALSVHGWIYGLADGLLRDLEVTQSGA